LLVGSFNYPSVLSQICHSNIEGNPTKFKTQDKSIE
jgi:hypothetical protein